MEQHGIPVRYFFEGPQNRGNITSIDVLHTTRAPVAVPGGVLPSFEVHSSTSKQILKNKTIIDESNTIIASGVRLPNGDVLHFPAPPHKGEVILTYSNGKPVWQQSNDDKVRGLISAVDSMTGGMAAAIESLSKRVDAIEDTIKGMSAKVDERFNSLEETVDVDTTRSSLSRLRSDVSVIMEVIDGLIPDNYPENGTAMSTKLAKNVIASSNPVFNNGRVFIQGNLGDVIGALCRIVSNTSTPKN